MKIKVMKADELEFELPVPSFYKHNEDDIVLGLFEENLIFISVNRVVTSVQIERIREDMAHLPSSTVTKMLTRPDFEKATREDFDRVMNLMFEHTRETSHKHEGGEQ